MPLTWEFPSVLGSTAKAGGGGVKEAVSFFRVQISGVFAEIRSKSTEYILLRAFLSNVYPSLHTYVRYTGVYTYQVEGLFVWLYPEYFNGRYEILVKTIDTSYKTAWPFTNDREVLISCSGTPR